MKKSTLVKAVAAVMLCSAGAVSATPAPSVCASADVCVYEGFEDGNSSTVWGSGVTIGLDLTPDLAFGAGVGASGTVSATLLLQEPTIDSGGSPNSALCPATGSYVVIAEDGAGYMVQVVLTSGCFCGFSLNPATRTFILDFDNTDTLLAASAPNSSGVGQRCDNTTETFVDWYMGPDSAITTTTTVTSTPDAANPPVDLTP